MSSHSYNTRSKKTLTKGSIIPPNIPPSDKEEEEEPLTIYLDDILKTRGKSEEMMALSLINLMTGMANSELQNKHRLETIRKKKKDKQDLNVDNVDNEEGISLESLLKKAEDYSDSEDSYDSADEEYCEMWEDDTMQLEDAEWNYFHELEKPEKKKIMHQFKKIKNITNNKPIRFKIMDCKLPLDIKSLAMQKAMSLNQMDNSSGEYYKSEQWLKSLMSVPFGRYETISVNTNSDKIDISNFLDNLSTKMTDAIYGHEEAKCQILQTVGQKIRNPSSTSNVIAIQGPMGNGKTTLVKEGIAKALGLPFAFIALGGATDASYFDGHNFTYEGSRHGKIVDILIQSKCMNPIIYFDELDKISETNRGTEIVHLLTHLTDASQNMNFNDNYFTGVDFDLSKAMFIFSFNDESKVDPILKDRMNVINTDGFSTKEKRKIANKYLLPSIFKEYGIPPEDIIFNDEVITNIIENYTNSEKGVRNLKRCLQTIISKINIWTMIGEDKTNIPFVLKNVSYPYTVTIDTCSTLLKMKKSGVPIGMYM